MNIIYISDKKKWGGIVSWQEKTAIGLQDKGHKVWIFSHPKSALTKKGDKRLNIVPFKIGNDYNLFALIKLLAFVKKNNVNIILSNIKRESVIADRISKICNIPHIRRIGTENDLNHSTIQKLYKKNRIKATISPCKFMIDEISKRFSSINKNEFYAIYNGRNIKEFSTKEIVNIKSKYKIPEDKIIIGTLCQLSESKNILGLLDVFSDLLKKHKNIHLVIAGAGPQADLIKEKISSLGLKKNCSFLGFVKESQEISATFDIGVLYSYMEGFSNSVVEFMSVGTPVVCTDVGGQNEIIEDDKNGYLVTAGQNEMLLEKLNTLILDKSKRLKMGKEALKTVKAKFSENKMIDEVEKLYEKTIL